MGLVYLLIVKLMEMRDEHIEAWYLHRGVQTYRVVPKYNNEKRQVISDCITLLRDVVTDDGVCSRRATEEDALLVLDMLEEAGIKVTI